MNDRTETKKKVWVTPALDELEIEKTLGGTVPMFRESQQNINFTNRGSYPG